MKHLSIFTFLILFSFSLSGQESQISPSNSIGLSYLYGDYGNTMDFNESFNLDYRRKLGDKSELRASLKLAGDDSSFFNAVRLGFSESVWQKKKINFYVGADVEWAKVGQIARVIDCFPEDRCFMLQHNLNLHTFVGLEYNPTSRLGIRLEQRLVSANRPLTSRVGVGSDDLTAQFFLGTSVGMHYRF
jgi:hypothetical protein